MFCKMVNNWLKKGVCPINKFKIHYIVSTISVVKGEGTEHVVKYGVELLIKSRYLRSSTTL